jgi:nitrogen fixation/metabolism regulation signal transduction histidine kinase
VALAASDAEQAAQEAFAPILERQAEADAVRQKLVLLQRFEALFRLPARVQELAAEKDYQGVVTEYMKGKKLIPVQDHALWKEVARRLEHETAAVCVRLPCGLLTRRAVALRRDVLIL